MPLQTVLPLRLYRQIAGQIAALIDSGEFPTGSRLPAERELASAARRVAYLGARGDHLARNRRPRRSARRHRHLRDREPGTGAPAASATIPIAAPARSSSSRRASWSRARSSRWPRATRRRPISPRSRDCVARMEAQLDDFAVREATDRDVPRRPRQGDRQRLARARRRRAVEPARRDVAAHAAALPHAQARREDAARPRGDSRRLSPRAIPRARAKRDAPAPCARRARVPARRRSGVRSDGGRRREAGQRPRHERRKGAGGFAQREPVRLQEWSRHAGRDATLSTTGRKHHERIDKMEARYAPHVAAGPRSRASAAPPASPPHPAGAAQTCRRCRRAR